MSECTHTHTKKNETAQLMTSVANRTKAFKINFGTNSCLNSFSRYLIKIMALSKKKLGKLSIKEKVTVIQSKIS